MASSSDDDASSSSDEEFLTSNKDNIDREAIVRRKLLENFYGKSAAAPVPAESFDTDDDDDDDIVDRSLPADLDSKAFDAQAHTRRHIEESSLQTILETEEKLALQVRTLDSTMQTLVYENYSRFIDATDAIKSIGVNVTANEEGLASLSGKMESIDTMTRKMEDELGTIRDQVAEKLRIKRLLKRLDALLKLPKALKQEIQLKKYRQATKRFLAAQKLLAQHSQGFESLQKIEIECHSIMDDMKADLNAKLMHWSGVVENPSIEAAKNMAEILECAGTLYLLKSDDEEEGEALAGRAISSCARNIDRLLDSHMIQVQERQFRDAALVDEEGGELIPTKCLDAILETTTLYGMNFGTEQNEYLIQFVTESFASFISHVRTVLVDESARVVSSEEDKDKEISQSLSILTLSVQDLSSALTLPEIGLNADFAARLVNQAVKVTEYMVQRRVDRKFYELRLGIIQNCILPYAENVAKEWREAKGDKNVMPDIIQMGGSALSDCMQLVDDTIRTIFVQSDEESTSESADMALLKEAVDASTKDFISWLSSTFERLAGGEGVLKNVIETRFDKADGEDDLEDLSRGRTGASKESEFEEEEDVEGLLSSAIDEFDVLHEDSGGDGYILALVELCRLAAKSVRENLDQSIANHAGSGKKKGSSLFAGESVKSVDSDFVTSQDRFEHSASRILVIYAMNCGFSMGLLLCQGLTDSEPGSASKPREVVLKALLRAKEVSIECADIFGESPRAGPLPSFDDNVFSSLGTGSPMSRMTGLQFDIERMFKETVTVLPHPSQTFKSSRNEILFLAFKIAIRNMLEFCRLGTFTPDAISQLKFDVEFLKYIMPHYVSKDFHHNGSEALSSLSNLLNDVFTAAEDRCTDESFLQGFSAEDTIYPSLRGFVESLAENEAKYDFLVQEADN